MRTEADGTTTWFPLDHPTSEVAVAWYLELAPTPSGNVMAMVFRDGPDQPWKLVVRTRMYVDDKSFGSRDRRNGLMFEATPDSDPATCRRELIDKGDDLLGGLMTLGLGKLYRQSDHTSLQEFLTIWGKQPWGHMRPLTPEELEERRAREQQKSN